MRKCHHTSNGKIKGIFHGFFQEGNLEHGCDPVALVELEDGTIEAPCASSIQFYAPLKEEADNSASDNKDYAAALNRLKGPEIGNKSRTWNEAIDACVEEIQRLNPADKTQDCA